jgi:Ca2+-binding RTX toxin-like protein
MAVTAAERLRIEKLVVLMFDAAPGAAYLAQVTSLYEAAAGDLQRVAGTLDDVPVFQALHPPFQTATEYAADFLAPLGLQGDAVARDFIVSRMAAGASKGEIAFAALQVLAALPAQAAAQYQAAKAILDHKAAVADYYSAVKAVSQTDLPLLQSVLDGVTADAATVAQAIAEIDAGSRGAPGLQVIAGTSAETIVGSPAADVVHGLFGDAGATYTAGDSIDGAGGFDQLELVATGTAPAAPVIVRNVESIAILDTVGATFDALLVEGNPTIAFSKTLPGQVSRVLNASIDSTIGLSGRGDLTVDYANTAGALDVASIALRGTGTSPSQPSTVDIADGGTIEGFHLTTSGTNYTRLVAGANAGDVTISGNGTNVLAFASLRTVAVIDASESTGTNTFDLGAGFGNGDTLRGGSGADTVRFHATAALGVVDLSGVETLEADIDADVALNLGSSTGLNTVTLSGGSGSFALSNASSELRTVNVESVVQQPGETVADFNDLDVSYAKGQDAALAVHLGTDGAPGFQLGDLHFVRATSVDVGASSTDTIGVYDPMLLDPNLQSLAFHADAGTLGIFGGVQAPSPSALRTLTLDAGEDAQMILGGAFGPDFDAAGVHGLAVSAHADASGGIATSNVIAGSYADVNIDLGEDASAALSLLGVDPSGGGMGDIGIVLASGAHGALDTTVNGGIGDIDLAAASGASWRLNANAAAGGGVGDVTLDIGMRADVIFAAQGHAQGDTFGAAGAIEVRMADASSLDAHWSMQGDVGAVSAQGGDHVSALLYVYSEHGNLGPAAITLGDDSVLACQFSVLEGDIAPITLVAGDESRMLVRCGARDGGIGGVDLSTGARSNVDLLCDESSEDASLGTVRVAGGDAASSAKVMVTASTRASVDLHDWLGHYEIVTDGAAGATIIAGAGGGSIFAGSGADALIGGAGADLLVAGAGDDTIEGGAGMDTLHGAAGNDLFVFDPANLGARPVPFASAAVTDRIADFTSGSDKLAFEQPGVAANYAENTAQAASLAALLADADAKLDGAVQYYFGVTGINGYLVYSADGAATGVVIELTGLADMAASDIVAIDH